MPQGDAVPTAGGSDLESAVIVDAAASAGVQSLVRGLAVIRAFDAEQPEMTLSEVARKTGLTRATARRFLLTLCELGYVRTDGKSFGLTMRVLDLGYSYLSGLRLPELAMPHLERLTAEVGESTSASVLDGTDIVYVARVPTKRIMSVGISLGTRFPAYATSMGRVLLAALPNEEVERRYASEPMPRRTERTITSVPELMAELERVRAQGWALSDQELELGLRSMAMPLTDARGRTVAAINVSSHISSGDIACFRSLAAAPLARAAEGIREELVRTGPVSRLLISG